MSENPSQPVMREKRNLGATRRRRRGARVALVALAILVFVGSVGLRSSALASAPRERVELLFFWSETCPHCVEARPFVEALDRELSWLEVESLEVSGNAENRERYRREAKRLGEEARYLPGFVYCDRLVTGFDGPEGSGAALRAGLEACHEGRPLPGDDDVVLPLLGRVDAEQASLPLTTIVIAALDAFNPCAFFVLLFLLSLLVHARERWRMVLVASIYVCCSGLVYFVFMAAWLNLFLWMGELRVVTIVAGVVALVLAGLNIKDYFWLGEGPSLSIPEEAKPGLFRRMRSLVRATRLPALIAGTVVLALVANSYELLCTAGFPMVYTRLLTLRALPLPVYYGYLALYNVVYVLPLAGIVVGFVYTLGARKLQEHEGRALKLLSGLMMGGLGALLLLAPGALGSLMAAGSILAAAVGVTVVAAWLDRRRRRDSPSAE